MTVAVFQLNESSIDYDVQGEGVSLVFVHEVATDHRLWLHQKTYFDRRYRMITVDLFGHGKAAWPKSEVSIKHAAQVIRHLLEHINTPPAFVIGVSLGAAVAVGVALDVPKLVRGLVLVSPWSHTDEHVRDLVGRLLRLAKAKRMPAHMDLLHRYLFPPAYSENHLPEVQWLRTMSLEQDNKMVANTWAACQTLDLRHQLGEVKAPTLVIAGMNDLFIPPYLVRALADRLPDVELEIWEETGHFPFLEDPVRFNRRLEAFFTGCLARSGETP